VADVSARGKIKILLPGLEEERDSGNLQTRLKKGEDGERKFLITWVLSPRNSEEYDDSNPSVSKLLDIKLKK